MPPRRQVPEVEFSIGACRHEGLAVGAERHGRRQVGTSLEPGHLFDVELSDAGHGLGAELHQVAAGGGHGGKPGEIGEGLGAPAGLMAGPQGLHLAEQGVVGFGLGRGAGLIGLRTRQGFGLGPAARLQVAPIVRRWPSSARARPSPRTGPRPAESRW